MARLSLRACTHLPSADPLTPSAPPLGSAGPVYAVQASDGNWLFELHRRVEAAVPAPFRTVYLDAEPSNEELALMLMDDDDARREAAIAAAGGQLCDDAKLRSAALTDFRDRGRVSRAYAMRARGRRGRERQQGRTRVRARS